MEGVGPLLPTREQRDGSVAALWRNLHWHARRRWARWELSNLRKEGATVKHASPAAVTCRRAASKSRDGLPNHPPSENADPAAGTGVPPPLSCNTS